MFVLVRGGSSTPSSGGEIFLDAATSTGRNPFTASVMQPTPAASPAPAASATPLPGSGGNVVASASGSMPGLYGGSRQVAACDKQKLITFLTSNPDKGRAWAGVEGISLDQIPTYINGLTAVILRHDTRVTNHGFLNGRATTYHDVLQAGTGVLVDQYGVPRARCYCGNPLTPPIPTRVTPTYTGPAWPGFSPTTVVVVQPAPQPITIITIVDITTGTLFGRPAGGDGATDTAAPPGTTPTAQPTAPPSPCLSAPASAGDQTCDLISHGTSQASSVFSSKYPVSAGLDGSTATSWFSAGKGADGEDSTFTWTVSSPVVVGSVSIIGNSHNADPAVRSGFTFTSVTVELRDANGAFITSRDSPLNDQDITVNFGGVTASVVKLVLHHHTDPSCGGFAELIVRGTASG